MTTLLAEPTKMIAKGAPHVIHNDTELAVYTDVLFRLTSFARPSRSWEEPIELLTLVIERYEETHYPVSSSDAVSVIRFLLEHQNLTQRDLIPEFGSESAVSVFLSHERKLTLDQVRKLSSRFNLSVDVFINPGRKSRSWAMGGWI